MAGRTGLLSAIGLMSGTSMDGIDVAHIRTDGLAIVERGSFRTYPYAPSTRRRMAQGLEDARKIVRRTDRPGSLATLETELTERHAAAVEAFLADTGLATGDLDLVGMHGQTVLHRPEQALTVQLGDAGVLARALGVRIVHDMRQIDVEAGGQGAPLAPVYHRALAEGLHAPTTEGPIAFLNIGGVANITIVGSDLVAFDCGPGNAPLDDFVAARAGIPYDAGGRIASEGRYDTDVIGAVLDRPFFHAPYPKSLDRNDIAMPAGWSPDLSNGARTLTRLIAESVARSLAIMPERPTRWIVTGGGARNPLVKDDLRELLAPATVETADAAGLSADAMEAEAWAYLAVRVAKGLPISEPGTTGRRPLGDDRAKYGNWL